MDPHAPAFKLRGLARQYGAQLDASCRSALDADIVDVHRLAEMVRLAARLAPPPTSDRVLDEPCRTQPTQRFWPRRYS